MTAELPAVGLVARLLAGDVEEYSVVVREQVGNAVAVRVDRAESATSAKLNRKSERWAEISKQVSNRSKTNRTRANQRRIERNLSEKNCSKENVEQKVFDRTCLPYR